MTRKTAFRILLAVGMLRGGSPMAFYFLLPKRLKDRHLWLCPHLTLFVRDLNKRLDSMMLESLEKKFSWDSVKIGDSFQVRKPKRFIVQV